MLDLELALGSDLGEASLASGVMDLQTAWAMGK